MNTEKETSTDDLRNLIFQAVIESYGLPALLLDERTEPPTLSPEGQQELAYASMNDTQRN
jgi:hypothetical protein